MSLSNVPELVLQRAVHRLLAQPGRRWVCNDGTVVQILSPGMINKRAGPDFVNLAMLHNGSVEIGEAEFHVQSSMWKLHGHHTDARYQRVILHIVLEDNEPLVLGCKTLVISSSDMGRALHSGIAAHTTASVEVDAMQSAAHRRLLRHTSLMRSTIRRVGIVDALRVGTADWFDRLLKKPHRPFPESVIRDVRSEIVHSVAGRVSLDMCNADPENLPLRIDEAHGVRIASEGSLLRRELLVNVVLPHAMAHANTEQRVALFVWYWSARARGRYSSLTRRYPECDQTYVWQQQGMLELITLR